MTDQAKKYIQDGCGHHLIRDGVCFVCGKEHMPMTATIGQLNLPVADAWKDRDGDNACTGNKTAPSNHSAPPLG